MNRDPQDNERALYQVAATQGGYFTAAEARSVGYAYSQQHYHVDRGRWERVGRGLYRLRDFPFVDRDDFIRWSLWSRNRLGVPQAVVSHDSALSVHQLSDVMPAKVHLTVPSGFRKPAPPGCVLHTAILHDRDTEQRSGYRVTTPLKTLVDVAASPMSQEHLDDAVADGLRLGLIWTHVLESISAPPLAQRRLAIALAFAQSEATRQ